MKNNVTGKSKGKAPDAAASSKPVGNGKKRYNIPKASALKFHEAAAGTTVDLEESEPDYEETRLAERLVSDLDESSSEVNILCETYGLRREELGRLTGFSLRALAGWAAGELPSLPAKRRLHEIRRLLDALSEIVKRESIPGWLHKSNPAFERLTPLQVIELGEMDRLWAMVHELGSGSPE
jgi:hypothetical protein